MRTWQRVNGKWLLIASHSSDFAGEALTRFPLPESDAERKIIEVAEGAPRFANVTLSDGRVLRMLAEVSGAKSVLEFGTSTGYSGLWLANALRKTGGKLTTFELDAERAAIARGNFKKAGVDTVVTLVEGDAHKELAKVKGPVDLVFIDAEKEGYRQYLEQVLPLVRPGGMIVAHNMRFPTPRPEFVEAVTTNPALDTVFIHMHDRGMSLSLKKR
jgi:predicted O-methyltransferase YrrM